MEKFRSIAELKTIIHQTVTNNPHRFKCGSEVKKKNDLFCLRKDLPPMMNPKINVPTDVPVTEDLLKSIGIKFISLTKQEARKDIEKCLVANVTTQIKHSPDIVSEVILKENKPDVIRERKQSRKNKGAVVNASIEKQRKLEFEMSSSKRQSITSAQNLTETNESNSNNLDESTVDHCELSDDTSKSTLDWIIPTPKNFRGLNNPFHSQYKPDVVVTTKSAKNSKNVKRNGNFAKNNDKHKHLRAAEGFRIVRTIKRRLSAKDLLIGKNQEVKRRKMRRSSGEIQVISTTIQPSSLKLPMHLPCRSDYKEWNNCIINRQGTSTPLSSASSISSLSAASASTSTDVCNTLKRTDSIDKKGQTVRLLRQRRSQNYSEKSKRTSAGTDNVDKIEITAIDRARNMSLYFGSLNRIEKGEQFFILARRTTNDGLRQFLLEWEASKNNAIATKIEDFNIPSSEPL